MKERVLFPNPGKNMIAEVYKGRVNRRPGRRSGHAPPRACPEVRLAAR